MSLSRISALTKAYEDGRYIESSFRKLPALASTQGVWCDLSSAPGNPRPNYWTGAALAFTTLNPAYGLYHGGSVAPMQKRLHKFCVGALASGVTPCAFVLCDYIGFYPLVDMDSTDTQEFDNTTPLPRYADGVGVEMMLVATNPYIGGAQFSIDYISTDGSTCTSRVETSNVITSIGTIVHAGAPTVAAGGPFIRRPAACRGVQRASNITFLAPNGGLAALVLVKPLGWALTSETTAYTEEDFIVDRKSLPEIKDGAYLNMIAQPNGSVAGVQINGMITTFWN